MKTRLLLTALCFCSLTTAMAQEFSVDGSTYSPTSDNTVALTKFGGDETAVVIPSTVTNEGKEYTVTSIGDKAFSMKYNVASVTMPSTITKVGSSAFYFCGASTITLSENIDTLESEAFYGTSWYLKKLVNFPKHLKYVGERALYSCSSLTDPIYLDKDVVLGDEAFEGCGANEVDIIGEPKSVGEGALEFEGLSVVNCHLSTPPSFDPNSAFNASGEVSLDNCILNVPKGAKQTYMLDDKWRKFGTINEIDFAGGETYVDPNSRLVINNETAGGLSDLFPSDGQSRIKSLIVSGNLNGDDISAILGLSLDSLDISDANIVAGGGPYVYNQLGQFYTANDTIGKYMFMNYGFGYVNLPKSVKYIDDDAFDGSSLSTVVMGDNVTALGSQVFSQCNALDSVHLSANLEDLGDFTFATCNNLKHITLPSTLKKIGNDAFYYCKALDNVVLPESLETIDDQAFFDCENLSSIFLPKNVTEIGLGAFDRCYKLAGFSVADDNTAWKAVDGVLFTKDGTILERYPVGKADEEYTIPDGTKGVETTAFWETQAKTITMSDDVTTMGDGAFQMANNLETIKLSKNLTNIGIEAFFMDGNLKNIEIPASVATIGHGAFMSCGSLAEAVVPEGVELLDDDSFWGCTGLKKVTIPSTVKSIGATCFWGCTALDSVVVNAVEPPTCDERAFSEVEVANVNLIVPAASVDAYKAADIWKDFNIQSNTADGIRTITTADATNNDIESVFSISGARQNGLTKGINIVRYRNGRTAKVVVK